MHFKKFIFTYVYLKRELMSWAWVGEPALFSGNTEEGAGIMV